MRKLCIEHSKNIHLFDSIMYRNCTVSKVWCVDPSCSLQMVNTRVRLQQCFIYCYRSLRLLLEQLLAGVVLLPTLDKLADPDFINNLLIILVDDGEPPTNPDPPSESVEILAHFSVPNSASQSVSIID